MHKSLSAPNLQGLMSSKTHCFGIRKNVSANALPSLEMASIMDAMIVSNAPINQSVSCMVSAKFPNGILEPKVDEELMTCLLTPCEAPKPPEPYISSSTIARVYLQRAVEDEETCNRYNQWLLRVRKSKKQITTT